MVKLGYAISSEEMSANEIIENARHAEEVGFSFIGISDHFHPWIDEQGQSTFVWSMLGALSQSTRRISYMTAVTAPIIRIHPVILAQATATTAILLKNRFYFGVGTGENLNEHVIGAGWPPIHLRFEMLREALDIIRKLWTGKIINHYGKFYTVENARIYSLPRRLPPIYVSALGSKAAVLAGEIGDGLISTKPDVTLVKIFENAGGVGKPKFGQVKVCVQQDPKKAQEIAFQYWPFTAIPGQTHQEMSMPYHFEQLGKAATPEALAKQVVCGMNKQAHLEQIQKFIQAGYDHVYIGNIGPDQNLFFDFYQREILPEFQ